MGTNYRSIFRGLASESELQARQHFQDLCDNSSPRLYSSAKKFLKSEDFAIEAVSNVFVEIWQRRKEIGIVDNPESILHSMLKKHALEVIRKYVNMDIKISQNIEKWNHLNDSGIEINIFRLSKVIEKFSPTRSKIFKLAMIEGMDSKLISKQLNLSLNAVHHHLKQGIKESQKSAQICETQVSDGKP